MKISHITSTYWGKAYRLHLWKIGATLDWGVHRFIIGFDMGNTNKLEES